MGIGDSKLIAKLRPIRVMRHAQFAGIRAGARGDVNDGSCGWIAKRQFIERLPEGNNLIFWDPSKD